MTRDIVSVERSALTGFAVNPVNRHAARRDDDEFVDGLRKSDAARMLVLSGDVPALKKQGERHDALFTVAEAEAFGTPRETAFLGTIGERAYFALLVEAERPENAQGDEIAMIDLRTVATQGLVEEEVIGLLGQAKSLMYWHSRHRFCPHCGAPTRVSSSGWRRECDACAAQHFPRVDPVVIMLAVDGDTCLLGRAPRFPPGMYSCLAGFIEGGETFEDAVRREIFEEAGIAVGRVDYVASQPWPFPSSLMIGCLAHAASRDLVVDRNELDDARWFDRAEVEVMLRQAHPDGLTCPPKLAIANLLVRLWAEGEIG